MENKASKIDLTDVQIIIETIPEWTPSITESLPDFETGRRRSPDETPLLKQLLDAEEENTTHAEYTVHFLIELQARKYAFAVEDVLRVFKSSTECIEQCIFGWRADINGCCNEIPTLNYSSTKTESDLTVIGKHVLMMSERLKSLNEADALTFWTSKQRDMVLVLLASCSKDTVKLRRKLGRIKDSLEDRVKNMRRVAIRCNCEITDNAVPPEIYYKWVNEDAILYQNTSTTTDTTTIATTASSVENMSKIKEKLSAVKKTALDLLSHIRPTNDLPSLLEAETDSCTTQSSVSLNRPVQVYQMEKHVEILHKIDNIICDEDSVCEKSLINFVPALVSSTSHANAPDEEAEQLMSKESWTSKRPYRHLETLQTIESNVANSQKFRCSDYVYDHLESRIKEMHEQGPSCGLDDDISNGSTVFMSPSNNLEEDSLDHDAHSISIYHAPANVSPEPLFASQSVNETLNQITLQEHISSIVDANETISHIVTKTTTVIRQMESEWLSPEKMQNYRKELYHLIDFIVETAKLTQNPEFSARIYQEDKEQIVSVLDPVLRELTNSFMSIYKLHSLVTMDCQCLKQLVSGFTKGGQVIRDWVSNPSSDEELTDADNEQRDFNLDVDELFA